MGSCLRKLLRVNLTSALIKEEEIPDKIAKEFIGGRGLASKYLYDELDFQVDPLSDDNKLIFVTGAVTGTFAPTAGRYMVVCKAPLTGTIACSNSGGFFGPALKRAGFDMVIVEGRAKEPVYLYITDTKVEIRDASELWGKDTSETTDILMRDNNSKNGKVACIGQAGENLVKFASIINDKHRSAGRSGVGAVMGSKKLKALFVDGDKKVEIFSNDFKNIVKAKNTLIKGNPVTAEALPKLGTKVLDNIINENGLYPTKNFQEGVFQLTDEVCGEALVEKGYLKKNIGCFACPIACGRVVELPNGLSGEGPEYESGWAYGANCGVSDLIAICEANFLCNLYGLDTISTGCTIACAMELFEKGFIKKDELGNAPLLNFGSSEAIVYYTKKIALREGFGDKLAEGSFRVAESYGVSQLAMTVKKQELPAYDPRGVQGHGLQYATSNRGGCHVRGYMISPEILGSPQKLDPQSLEGKPEWVKIFQDLTAVIDSSGMCLFSSFALGADDYKDIINAVTGFNYTTEDIMKVGERIYNLERVFNLKAGIKVEEDTLPTRFLKDPMPEGPNKGNVSKLDQLLPAYYKLRGWKDGIPSPEKLKELSL